MFCWQFEIRELVVKFPYLTEKVVVALDPTSISAHVKLKLLKGIAVGALSALEKSTLITLTKVKPLEIDGRIYMQTKL